MRLTLLALVGEIPEAQAPALSSPAPDQQRPESSAGTGGAQDDAEEKDDDEGHDDNNDDFGDDFDDFEEGGEDDDFGDFDDGFQQAEANTPASTAMPQPQASIPSIPSFVCLALSLGRLYHAMSNTDTTTFSQPTSLY